MKVAVVGAGSWGTAFATIPASNDVDTVVWARRQELADAITSTHECPDYLPGVELPSSLRATSFSMSSASLSSADCSVVGAGGR